MSMSARITLFSALFAGVLFWLFTCTAANAGWLDVINTLSSPASSGADPDAFLAKAKASEHLIDKSSDSLFKAVASKEEEAKMEEMKQKLHETTDDKEKNTLRQQITESEIATIEKRAKDKELQEQAQHWDEKKKRHVGNSFYNFTLGSLQAATLVPEGTRIANSISNNPVNAVILAFKLNSVYEALKSLTGIISNTGKVIGAMKPLMSAANIEAKPASVATEAPREIEGGI
jgi:hypothetical protein